MTNQTEQSTVKAFGMTDPRSATIAKDVKTKMGLAFRKGDVVTVYNGGVIGSGPYTGQTSYSAYSSRNDVMTAIRPSSFRFNDESAQDRSTREWAENFTCVSANPEAASEKNLRRAIGYLDHARRRAIRNAQEHGCTLDANVLAGYDNECEYYKTLILRIEGGRPK
jgi:hypothetical protein